MASSFPAYIISGRKSASVQSYNVSTVSGETLTIGELFFYDTTDNRLERCGADPALIAGISEVDSASARLLTPDNYIPAYLLDEGTRVAMSSTTAYATTLRGDLYGIARDSTTGYWQVDTSDTSNTRVKVIDGNVAEGIFIVQFIAPNLQFSADN